MAKGIYLNERQSVVDRVYAGGQKERLAGIVDMHGQAIGSSMLDDNADILKNADYAFSTWDMPTLSEEQINAYLPNLKAVFYAAGSVQAFARPFLNAGIKVVSAWAANAVPVAEYAHAQILLANKGFFSVVSKGGADWRTREQKSAFPGNYRVKVGLLGAGMIGTMVIERLKANNVDVLVYDPFMSEERAAALGVEKTGLDEIFATCQTVSNHLANKEEIWGILNKPLFDLMPSTACFINTGRGRQVNEDDLCDALTEVPTRSAVLDVTFPEPPEDSSRLRKLPNVFLTPHIAGSSGNEVERMAAYMIDECERLMRGERLKYEVTPELLKTMA